MNMEDRLFYRQHYIQKGLSITMSSLGQTNTHQQDSRRPEDGFSSEEGSEEEIMYAEPDAWQEEGLADNQKIKMKLDPVRQIAKKQYSLEPDMLNGWAPKGQLAKPIPMTFRNYSFDSMLESALKAHKFSEKLQLCYLGPRYETTYYAWYDKNFDFPYQHLSAPKNIKITDRFLCGQHWDAERHGILFFDSLFESGNLDCVLKVGETEYDLYMRVDSNTKGHLHWYNFKVKNFEMDKCYKFTICNFQKGKSLYSRGMRPYYFSMKKYLKTGVGWRQLDCVCSYKKRLSKSQKFLENEEAESSLHLTFSFTPEYQDDELQFAYCIPYTYSYFKHTLKGWETKCEAGEESIMKTKKLCMSLGGLDVQLLTITSNVEEEQRCFRDKIRQKKKVIFVTGRCHPGETNGSWMVEGLVDFLIGSTETAHFLRQNIIFKIIPMLNPDGVVIGNYRTGLMGKDFNRQFSEPDRDLFPQIYCLKQLFWSYKQLYQHQAFMYLDFHGHSVKKNVFAYGPEYPIIHKNYYESRMIPKLISLKTNMFRYYSCIFKIAQAKQTTGRAIFLKNMKIPFTFTIEASNGSFYDQITLENIPFDEQKWKEVGAKLMEGISEYIVVLKQLEKIREQKNLERKKMRSKNTRDRVQSKKMRINGEQKNNKYGYNTSLGFRRTKNVMIAPESSISLANVISTGELKTQGFDKLLQSIKNQGNSKEQDRQSDDEISEGNSDSQGSQDDLPVEQLCELIHIVKAKKGPIRGKSMKTEPKQNVKVQSGFLKTMYNEEGELEDQEMLNKQNSKKNTRDIFMKKYLWRKKSSLGTSPSPKRQDTATPMAKIVNFNFSLRPVQTKGSSSALKNEEKKNFQKNGLDTQQSFTDFHSKKAISKPYQFSETFKKTFMSVQKEILRRDSHKRYLVAMNNSATKQKPSLLLDNVRGKKIDVNEDF